MDELRLRLEAIDRSPEGPTVAAYLDFDGTVIAGYSASAFYRRRLQTLSVGVPELARTVQAASRGIHTEEDFADFLELTLGSWVGRSVEEVAAEADGIFRDAVSGKLHREMWEIAMAHRRRGHRVVLASSATRFQLDGMARELGVDTVLCTELETQNGVLTGRVAGASLWGDGKARAVVKDMSDHAVDPDVSFAYSNGAEDVPLLEAVGNPVAVAPSTRMREIAECRGWPILDCSPRPGLLPSLGDVARTAGFYGGVIGSIGTAIGIGLVNRSRREAVDLSIGVGGDVGLALAGIDVVVEGSEHLTAARPCVFVFNHQSYLDVPIMMKILRGGFTGVAKREAASMPIWGQFFRFADVAFVDRADSTSARAALAPAVFKLREEGISLAISPEGTRTPTPGLAPFKKGPFHIALQAEVPMVPIVIRNAGELMPRGAQTLRPGTVDVRVLPPVATDAWSISTLDEHVGDVWRMFDETLRDWRVSR